MQASRDGAAEASRRVSRTATRVLEGIWPAVAVLDDSVDTSALRRIAPRCCCARRLFAHVVELGGREWLL